MAKNKDQKSAMLDSYKELLANSGGVVLVRYAALNPNEAVDLKMALRNVGANYHVVKNTLFRLALKNAEMPDLADLDYGSHAVLFLGTDVAAGAKEFKKFAKEVGEKLEMVGGILDGNVLTASQVAELADMPSKEQSIAMIAGILTQPLSGVVGVLEDSMRSVVSILDQAYAQK